MPGVAKPNTISAEATRVAALDARVIKVSGLSGDAVGLLQLGRLSHSHNMTTDFIAVATLVLVKPVVSRFNITVETGILRPFVAVHKIRHVPGILHGQRAALTQRHVGTNKMGSGVYTVHAGTPVERVLTPQRWKDDFAIRFSTLPIGAMTKGAVLFEDLLAALKIRLPDRFGEFRITAAGYLTQAAHKGAELARRPASR